MPQIILGVLLTVSIILIACICFYVGYRQGSKQNHDSKKLTDEQREAKRKRERIEDQFDKMFSFSIHKAKEKKVN
jgi:hypothetical protein